MNPLRLAVWITLWMSVVCAVYVCGAEANELTAEERAAGWRLLFDGKTTNGWRGVRKTVFPAQGWTIDDGWLKKIAKVRGGDLITVDQFADFELQWEWRLAPGGNNGVKYFFTETRGVGHEYQMIDDTRARAPKDTTATFYDVLPPKPHKPMRLAPETNHSRIIVRGNHVEHWLNDEQVAAYELGSDEVKAAVAQSKFRKVADYGTKLRGHILLTDHTDECWFRSIRIRELDGK
jgi:hypothetical protein